jgi:hypothetical protein
MTQGNVPFSSRFAYAPLVLSHRTHYYSYSLAPPNALTLRWG